MKRNLLSRFALPVTLAFAALLFFPMAVQAVHKSGTFFCLNCHNMHATRMWGGSGGSRLLRYTKGAEFCLQCHDETTNATNHVETGETPPYVVKIGGTAKPTTVGAGGYFYGMTALPSTASPFTSDNAHNMDVSNPTPPASTATITGTFYCVNCHDQHGTSGSDLVGITGSSMLNGGANATYTVDAFRNLKRQLAPADTTDLVAVETSYTNTRYRAGIAAFCAQCHTLADDGPGSGYHPVDLQISNATFAGTNYTFAMDDTLTNTGQPIIKPEDPINDDAPTNAAATARDPSGDDQVVCLTCHYAHGGPYTKNLRWQRDGSNMIAGDFSDPNTDTVPALADRASAYGCQVCHNK